MPTTNLQDTPGRPDCRTGCNGACNQGRLPCPHRPADVPAMREMGVDLRPPTMWGRPGRGAWPSCTGHCGENCVCTPREPFFRSDDLAIVTLLVGVLGAMFLGVL